MPYLNVKLAASCPPELYPEIASTLAHHTSTTLGKAASLAAIAMESVESELWYVAGVPINHQGKRTFYIEVHITAGTNTKAEKSQYISDVFASMENLLGSCHPASYIVIKDIAADSWGYAGATQEKRFIEGKSL